MGRIRTIKPEFPHNEKWASLSIEVRYCYIMLWTIADDEGRLYGSPRLLASLLFPFDDEVDASKVDNWLNQLEKKLCIVRYSDGADHYIQIFNWLTHQKIDKPSKSRLPAPKARERSSADLVSSILDLGSSTLDLKQEPARKQTIEKKGKAKQSTKKKESNVTADVLPLVKKPPKSRIVEGWKLDARNLDYGRRIGLSEVECAKEWLKFYGHHAAKGTEFVNWNQAWENWARRAMEYTGRVARDPSQPLEAPTEPQWKSFTIERWKQVLRIYGGTNNWYDNLWGPPPGTKGCKVPTELLAEAEPEFDVQEGGK